MRALSKHIRVALPVWVVLTLSSGALAQPPRSLKNALVLHWEERDHPANTRFDQDFQAALQARARGDIECYSEYLDSTKFPGENQSELLSDYLRRKYAGRHLDVVVTHSSPALDFLLKYRANLFPHVPIVFANERPVPQRTAAEADATGIVYVNSYRDTVDLALNLHPGTEQLFVISGTLGQNIKPFEPIARDALESYKGKLAITYLTGLTLEDLKTRLASLPERSIALYVWQQALDEQGKLLESRDVLARIAPSAKIPIYGMSFANVGPGIVGGYVWTQESNVARVADMTVRVAHGTRPADIPVENAPETPMFDWRQLQRWQIAEDRLPPGSVIQFRELTFWQQYKWRILGAFVIFVVQTFLIGALLIEGYRARRSRKELENYKQHLEQLVVQRTSELVEARDQALAANRSKSTFLANMSHELRTPLNAILGFSAMVRADTNLPDRHRRDLAVVGNSGEHLLRLIDRVLDMAKIETGRITVEIEPVDLRTLVGDTVNMMRERAQAKNLDLSVDVSSQVPQLVDSDPDKIRQVLTNLIGNAVKYTDDGGIALTVDCKHPDNAADLRVTFDVEDTGRGIAPADHESIFDPFVQVGSPRTTKGTGLGLSISRQFVQLLGGTIRVQSKLGRGSLFHVELPVARASKTLAHTPVPRPVVGLQPGQPDYRILIIEDQTENWLLLDRLLEEAGFQVQVAEDGGRAIEIFQSWRPHFIWTDLRLPVMSGVEVTKRIRRIEAGHDVKIVALTASAFNSQREEVLAAGMDDFLRKPYRPAEIFECMARHLDVRYVYGDAPPPSASDHAAVTLHPEDFAIVPASLRDELKDAIISLDRERIAMVVRRISEQYESLGQALGHLTEDLAYSLILRALDVGERELTGAKAETVA